MVPNEISVGLSLTRDIQHHIDLVPDARLPNKPAYRMFPKEHEELKRQVDELLAKELIDLRNQVSICSTRLVGSKEIW